VKLYSDNNKNQFNMGKFMLTRFSTNCAETGNRIPKGDYIFLDEESKKAYSLDSNRYKQEVSNTSESDYIIAQENAYYQRLYSNF